MRRLFQQENMIIWANMIGFLLTTKKKILCRWNNQNIPLESKFDELLLHWVQQVSDGR